jgi:hypothetical protein
MRICKLSNIKAEICVFPLFVWESIQATIFSLFLYRNGFRKVVVPVGFLTNSSFEILISWFAVSRGVVRSPLFERAIRQMQWNLMQLFVAFERFVQIWTERSLRKLTRVIPGPGRFPQYPNFDYLQIISWLYFWFLLIAFWAFSSMRLPFAGFENLTCSWASCRCELNVSTFLRPSWIYQFCELCLYSTKFLTVSRMSHACWLSKFCNDRQLDDEIFPFQSFVRDQVRSFRKFWYNDFARSEGINLTKHHIWIPNSRP